jgi:hypothetical protein
VNLDVPKQEVDRLTHAGVDMWTDGPR